MSAEDLKDLPNYKNLSDEKRKELDRSAGMAEIMSVFGETDQGVFDKILENSAFESGDLPPSDSPIKEYLSGDINNYSIVSDSQSFIDSIIASAAENENLISSGIDERKGTALNYFGGQQDDQFADTNRSMGFALARRGQTGGSMAVDMYNELIDSDADDEIDFDVQANKLGTETRGANADLMSSLMDQFNAGSDAGILSSSAQQGVNLNAENAYNNIIDYNTGENLNRFSDLYSLNEYNEGIAQARATFNPTTYAGVPSNSSSYGGTIT